MNMLVRRLWRLSGLRAAGVPSRILRKEATLIRQAKIGLGSSTDKAAIRQALYAHILQHTYEHFEPPFCLTCTKLGSCEEQHAQCMKYEMDQAVYDICTNQLYRSIELLNGVFGFDSKQMTREMDSLLNTIKAKMVLLSDHKANTTSESGGPG